MLVNECSREEAIRRNLPFCQQVQEWAPHTVVSFVTGNKQAGEPFMWTFNIPSEVDVCYDIRVRGKIGSVRFGVSGRSPLIDKSYLDGTWSWTTREQHTEVLDVCITPLRLGLLNAQLKVDSPECPVVYSTCVWYMDPILRRKEVKPVIQGYSHVPDHWDCKKQCLI